MTDAHQGRDVEAMVRGAELMLHAPAIRRERAALEQLLADDFVAFGTSGLVWARGEFLDSVMRFASSTSGFEVTDMATRVLAPGVILVSYLTTLDTWRARRSSVWRIENGEPKLVFHQGTTIS